MARSADLESRRREFYARAGQIGLAPLWTVMRGLVTQEPQSPALPAMWCYLEAREHLIEACDLIGTAEAERRVLVLENPGLRGESKITGSLYAGLQIVLPGETAPPHRHVAAALRFVIEGTGGITTVNAERTRMSPGDFIVTPSWTWHEHANDGKEPVVWLDGLDVHIVNLLDASFREDESEYVPAPPRPENASHWEAGLNLLPADLAAGGQTSPLFNYPYSRSREALHGVTRSRDVDPCHGYKLRYVNPSSGGWAIPTLSTWIQMLPASFASKPYRSTDGTLLIVVEGRGYSLIGGRRFGWQEHDVLVIPSWCEASHHAAEEAVLFGASDRVVQEKLGLWRERRSEGGQA
jgi:gentisate 1,2-dioxygenase